MVSVARVVLFTRVVDYKTCDSTGMIIATDHKLDYLDELAAEKIKVGEKVNRVAVIIGPCKTVAEVKLGNRIMASLNKTISHKTYGF